MQAALDPRLSLDCGIGTGPSHTLSSPAPSDEPLLTLLAPPSSPNTAPANAPHQPAPRILDSASDQPLSCVLLPCAPPAGNSSTDEALPVHGDSAAAVLTVGGTDSRQHRATRALRGRASLDAMLLFGALVRAVDEAGLAVGAPGLGPRLERIESGDLPAADSDGGGQQVLRPRDDGQRQGRMGEKEQQEEREDWRGAGSGSSSVPAAAAGQPSPVRRFFWPGSRRSAADAAAGTLPASRKDGCGEGGAGRGTGAAAGDFTFSTPAMQGEEHDGGEGGSAPEHTHGQQRVAQHGRPQQQQHDLAEQDMDAQVFGLFMRLLTLTSTLTSTDVDLLSSMQVAERSSQGASGVGGAAHATAGGGAGVAAAAGLSSGGGGGSSRAGGGSSRAGRLHVSRSASEVSWLGPFGGGCRSSATARWRQPRGSGGSGGEEHRAAAAATAAALMRGADRSSAPASQSLRTSPEASTLLFTLPVAPRRRRNSLDVLTETAPDALAAAAAAAAAILVASGSNASAAGAGSANESSSKLLPMMPSPRVVEMHGERGPGLGRPRGESTASPGLGSLLLAGAFSRQFSRQMSGYGNSAGSLIRLPTGSGSLRDVLSRLHQERHQEGNRSSSGSWSARTGLASLFDAHLTAALRRNGAVRTFKRAVCGDPGSLSRASGSSATNQLLGTLSCGESSLGFTGSLVLPAASHRGRISSSIASGPAAAGGGGAIGSGVAGVSQLGAAAAAAAAAGLGGMPLPPPPPPPPSLLPQVSSCSTVPSMLNSPIVLDGRIGSSADLEWAPGHREPQNRLQALLEQQRQQERMEKQQQQQQQERQERQRQQGRQMPGGSPLEAPAAAASGGSGGGGGGGIRCARCGGAVSGPGECGCATARPSQQKRGPPRRSLSLGPGEAWTARAVPTGGAAAAAAAERGNAGVSASGREPSLRFVPAPAAPAWEQRDDRRQEQAAPRAFLPFAPSASLDFSAYSWETDWGPRRRGGGPGGGDAATAAAGALYDAFTCTDRSSLSQTLVTAQEGVE